jgi:FO synthase
VPAVRLQSLRAAGAARIPMTTGLLIGIGETRGERIEGLLAIRDLHDDCGHIQEVIIQNFVPKADTPMARVPAADFRELLWTVAVARLTLGPSMRLQVPPNLNPGRLTEILAAGIDDWGGVSPVTSDHVNPESPWPQLSGLAEVTNSAGKSLVARLTLHAQFVQKASDWLDPTMLPRVLELADSDGFARDDQWRAGISHQPPSPPVAASATLRVRRPLALEAILAKATAGDRLSNGEIVELYAARDGAIDDVAVAADQLRQRTVGDAVTYVVNRNINYTNMCMYRCGFCAFSKGRGASRLRGPAYRLDVDTVVARAREAADQGATEVCMQGGIHPEFTGETYLTLCRAVKSAIPAMHIHAFSPLEVHHGATTLGISLEQFLEQLQAAGLGSLPGTAAEILDDGVRAKICPDKVSTQEWLSVIQAAHRVGLRTTSTIMFGHLETPANWAAHLLHIRDLQENTGGFTEFVPLPFVAKEAPLYQRGRARPGPTWREALLMHAVARLALHPHIRNLQASWVKLGPLGVLACLDAGVNDMGGTLMNESISSSAGASHGQELTRASLQELSRRAGRTLRQRNTLYEYVNAPA